MIIHQRLLLLELDLLDTIHKNELYRESNNLIISLAKRFWTSLLISSLCIDGKRHQTLFDVYRSFVHYFMTYGVGTSKFVIR